MSASNKRARTKQAKPSKQTANVRIHYYDPEQGNRYSGWGESHSVVPHSTLIAPTVREASLEAWYEYHFDETTQRWRETTHTIPQPPPAEEEEKNLMQEDEGLGCIYI